MDRSDALSTMKEVAAEVLSVDPDQVTEEARFKEDLDADSLDLVELIMGLEERFDITVPEEDLEGVTTVGQALDLVLAKDGGRSRAHEVIMTAGPPGPARASRSRASASRPPPGTTSTTFWETISSGRSAAALLTIIDPSDLPVQFGCEVADFDPTAYLGAKEARRLDRVTQLGFAAAADALADAGDVDADPARCAVVIGTGVGGLITLEEQVSVVHAEGTDAGQPVLRADDDDERDRRHRRHAVRLDRREHLHLDRVRGQRARRG